jgi:multidrug efflux pump subunit AcrB
MKSELRGKCEEPGSDRSGRSADALHHGDDPDGSAAKLSPPVPGFAVAPLALIGVVMALLPSGAPLGFVAILGVLALISILIRNSVILIVQIEDLRNAGPPAWDAVVEATEHRMRPIMLTAAAASLALIPIAREIFWGPMAYAMTGGIGRKSEIISNVGDDCQ